MRGALLGCLLWLPTASLAEGLRAWDPIDGLGRERASVATVQLPVAEVEAVVQRLVQAWNARDLGPWLGEDFPDRERVLAELGRGPLDARLQLMAIGPVRTVDTTWSGDGLESLVAVTVRARVELDGGERMRRYETTQELLIRFIRRLED